MVSISQTFLPAGTTLHTGTVEEKSLVTLFQDAFEKGYRDSNHQIKNLKEHVGKVAKEDLSEMSSENKIFSYYVLNKDQKAIGWLSCEMKEVGILYIRQAAVAPQYQDGKVFKSLLLKALENHKPKRVWFLTRVFNTTTIRMAKYYGLEKSDRSDPNWPSPHFIAFEGESEGIMKKIRSRL